MKKFTLKKWYPSLKQDWSKGDIAEWFDGYYWNKGKVILNGLSKNEVENNPDFWELIEEEKPLFVTEDGVEIFAGDNFIMVEDDFTKHKLTAYNVLYTEDFKRFKNESSADEYIWKNKPVFSYEDFMRWGNVPYERVIKELAKERIEG